MGLVTAAYSSEAGSTTAFNVNADELLSAKLCRLLAAIVESSSSPVSG
jgi:hypothetical protein